MKRSEIIIISLLALILLGVIVVLINIYSPKNDIKGIIQNINQQIQSSNLSSSQKQDCSSISQEIINEIEDAKSCSQDSDCEYACFFSYQLINKNKSEIINSKITSFNEDCGLDNYCVTADVKLNINIECKSGKCQVKETTTSEETCTSDSQCSSEQVCIRYVEGMTNLYGGVRGTPENPGICIQSLDNQQTGARCLSDSDGGLNYGVKGNLNVDCGCSGEITCACGAWIDSCQNNKTLVEYFCDGANLNNNFVLYNCTNQCSDGACI